MRTAIFNQFTDLPKEFRDDFRLLREETTEEQRTALLSHIPGIYKTSTVGEEKITIDEAVSRIAELGGDAASVLRVIKVLLFVYRQWNPVADKASDFLKDLKELGLLPEDDKSTSDFLSEFLEIVQQDNRRRLEKFHASSLLPSYTGCATLVDLRAVIKKPFGTGLNDQIADYEPECLSFVPVILVKVRRDSGDPKSFDFQCEEFELRRMIDVLEGALKDLEAAKAALGSGEDKL
jgi:hypothetical protein